MKPWRKSPQPVHSCSPHASKASTLWGVRLAASAWTLVPMKQLLSRITSVCGALPSGTLLFVPVRLGLSLPVLSFLNNYSNTKLPGLLFSLLLSSSVLGKFPGSGQKAAWFFAQLSLGWLPSSLLRKSSLPSEACWVSTVLFAVSITVCLVVPVGMGHALLTALNCFSQSSESPTFL